MLPSAKTARSDDPHELPRLSSNIACRGTCCSLHGRVPCMHVPWHACWTMCVVCKSAQAAVIAPARSWTLAHDCKFDTSEGDVWVLLKLWQPLQQAQVFGRVRLFAF